MACMTSWRIGLILGAAAWMTAACGGGTGGGVPDGDPLPPVAVCTGPIPSNAMLCPGADSGLAGDTPRVVTGTSCACTAPCVPRPCSYACNAGYLPDGVGACRLAPIGPPTVQFTDNGDGTITVVDRYGQATWLGEANCNEAAGGVSRLEGPVSWDQAVAWSGGLADGACGLRDGSAAGDWLLPTPAQLLHLQVDLGTSNPFTGLQSGVYWSSFTYWTEKASAVDMYQAGAFDYPKSSLFYVWPIRLDLPGRAAAGQAPPR